MSLKSKLEKKKKYSYISIDDLNKMENRGIELTEEIKHIDFINNPEEFSEKSKELYRIISDLKKYKKYAKN